MTSQTQECSPPAKKKRAVALKPELPPVVLLEGSGSPNGLSVARSLGKRGIKVYSISPEDSKVRRSRYCTWIPETTAGKTEEEWNSYLLGSDSNWLKGAVLLACFDGGLKFVANHYEELSHKFLLDACHPPAQRCMLDKLSTYQAAAEAGVTTPRFWVAQSRQQVMDVRDELVYPLLVKPLSSNEYRKHFGLNKKFATVDNFSDLLASYEQAEEVGVDVMLVEKIPGNDDQLCSYYTYMDEHGNAVFDYTKRIIRRFPVNMGLACYHITDWIPELIEPSLKLFRHVGLRGLANVEFKRDERDGEFKLIECNARFTGGNGLVADSGYDLASFVYNRIVGLPQKPFGDYQLGKRLWSPIEDFYAFRQLHREKKITIFEYLKSIAHPMTFTSFKWYDPWPTIAHESKRFHEAIARRLPGRKHAK